MGARGYFEKAAQLDPDLVEAHLNRGCSTKLRATGRMLASFRIFLAKASPRQYGGVIPKVRAALVALQ